jgi:predicted membrane-bound mannosyltransferase
VQLPEPERQRFRMGYYAIAIIMIVTPAAVIVMTRIFGICDKSIFIVETVGIVMFAAYWGLKSYELSMSKVEGIEGWFQRPEATRSLRMRAARLLA